MKIFFTKKQLENYLKDERAALNYAKGEYKLIAAKFNYIETLFDKKFSEMSTDEIKEFFKYNPDIRIKDYTKGMMSGVDSTIDALEMCGIMKKRTLEKIRFRSKEKIKKKAEEQYHINFEEGN